MAARAARSLWIVGPGLMVMLADTDAGSVVTASASGARWGYRLLLLQLLLVPVLYAVMRLVVRLSLATGQGLTQILRTQFGTAAAKMALERAGLKAEDIDIIACATTTPDQGPRSPTSPS